MIRLADVLANLEGHESEQAIRNYAEKMRWLGTHSVAWLIAPLVERVLRPGGLRALPRIMTGPEIAAEDKALAKAHPGSWSESGALKAFERRRDDVDVMFTCWEYGISVEHITPDPAHRIALGTDGKVRPLHGRIPFKKLF